MKGFRYTILLSLSIVAIFGCGKEYSFENPLGTQNNITIGNNCIINRITELDTVTNTNIAAYNYVFNSTGTSLLNVSKRDSITNNTTFNKSLFKSNDTLFIDASQYFVVDTLNNFRVKTFVGYEEPFNITSPIFINDFSYDNTGKLIIKSVKNIQFPLIAYYESYYTYTNNNLTSIVSKIPLTNTIIKNILLEYENSRQPKNFFSFLPDCPSLLPYTGAINLGPKNLNPLSKVVITNYNQLNGAFIDSTVTIYKNYKYSSDNYVLSVDASGYKIPASPLVNGRNTFGYFCR